MRKSSRKLRKSKRSVHSTSSTLQQDSRTVTCSFVGNQYIGTLCQDSLGARSLDGPCEKYTWSTGVHYEGPFVASQVQGRGKFYWPDGSTYDGEVSNGKRHGEGIFKAADGVTRYEGQWREGKRHGHGRLLYDPVGEAFYEGEWEDGAKHGEGRQVWPSKNTYEGQWRYGRMAGQGTMTWKDGDMIEEYRGNWEDDHPEGQGTHTWYANECPLDATSKAMPSQQMNNRYEGDWHDGVRHGKGTFSYANGARYHGAWDNNAKQGDGRYTFEDGRVYCGPFEHDQMTANTEVPATSTGRPLNIGNEDNPVRRCIDISDLEPLALPVDVGPHDFEIGSGYDEEHEVMREVHNMLLRYLGELKQCYAHYKAAFPRPGADPFVLSSHQFWVFCRDVGIVTPACPLSHLNRTMRAGHRHHQEAAFEDLEDLRPLTPTVAPKQSSSTLVRRSSEMNLGSPGNDEVEAESEGSQQEASEAGEESSAWSSSQESHATPEEEQEQEAEREQPAGEAEDRVQRMESFMSRPSTCSRRRYSKRTSTLDPVAYPLYSKFWREEGGPNLVDVHETSGQMIFRHFLESIVRLSVSRYPNEKGLEHQVRRLFKESILPVCRSPPSSETFAFLVETGMQEVFDEFHPALWGAFKENAVGEGAYDRPHWISLVEVEQPPEPGEDAPGPAEEAGAAEEEAGDPEDGEPAPPNTLTLPPLESRATRKGFAGQQRRVHLRAHLDVTVRVKDVLKLFDGAGLLQPLSECVEVPKVLPAYEPVFPMPCSQPSDDSGMGRIEGLQGLEAILLNNADADAGNAVEAGPVAPGGDGARPKEEPSTPNVLGSLKKSIMVTRGSVLQPAAAARNAGSQSFTALFAPPTPSESQAAEDALEKTDKMGMRRQISESTVKSHDGQAAETECGSATDDEAVDAESSLPAVLREQCDLRMSFYDLLSLALEVCSPEAVAKLHWSVDVESVLQDQFVALLDYVETEVCFPEFLRILVRFAERQTERVSMVGCLPLHKRLESFVRHIFVPALCTPYKPPQPQEPAPAEGEAPNPEQAQPPPEGPPSSAPGPSPKGGVLPVPPSKPRPDSKPRPVAKGAKQPAEAPPETEPPAAGEEEPPRPPSSPQPELPVFWRGFDEDEALDAGAVVAPRGWPDEYDLEVLEW